MSRRFGVESTHFARVPRLVQRPPHLDPTTDETLRICILCVDDEFDPLPEAVLLRPRTRRTTRRRFLRAFRPFALFAFQSPLAFAFVALCLFRSFLFLELFRIHRARFPPARNPGRRSFFARFVSKLDFFFFEIDEFFDAILRVDERKQSRSSRRRVRHFGFVPTLIQGPPHANDGADGDFNHHRSGVAGAGNRRAGGANRRERGEERLVCLKFRRAIVSLELERPGVWIEKPKLCERLHRGVAHALVRIFDALIDEANFRGGGAAEVTETIRRGGANASVGIRRERAGDFSGLE